MKRHLSNWARGAAFALTATAWVAPGLAREPLPSWSGTAPKKAIVADGDLQMLEWATQGAEVRFTLIVHHTDAEREWAYDRKSAIGKLDKALDAAQAE